MKKILLLVLVIGIGVLTGCRNTAKDYAKELELETTQISETFKLPKYINADQTVNITWESSDIDIINIIEFQEWEDGVEKDKFYKALVDLPTKDTEMILTAIIDNGKSLYEKEFQIYVVKDQYIKTNLNHLNELENGSLVKLNVSVTLAQQSLYAISDGTKTQIIHKNNNYNLGDELMIWAEVQKDSLELIDIKTEKINENPNFNIYDLMLLSLGQIDNEKLYEYEGMQFRLISNLVKINNKYYLMDPFNESQYIEIKSESISNMKDLVGKLVEAVVVLSNDKETFIPSSIRLYSDYNNYLDDYEKAKIICENLQRKFNVITMEDIHLPQEPDEYKGTFKWESEDISIVKNELIIYPNKDQLINVEVTIKIGEIILIENIKIEFIKTNPITIKDLKDSSQEITTPVIIEGIVMEVLENGYILKDNTADIFVISDKTPKLNTKIIIRGQVIIDDVFNLRQIPNE